MVVYLNFEIGIGKILGVQIICILFMSLTLLHSRQPKLYGVLAILSAIGLKTEYV